jgi:acyl-CoA hydrolase
MLRKGRTSVTYRVEAADARNAPERAVFQTNVTFVSVDDTGAKREI